MKTTLVKTDNNNWIGTSEPVIIPFSIHSAFNNGPEGVIKAEALVSHVKDNVQGQVTILMAEGAHVNTLSLKYENNRAAALDICKRDALQMAKLYEPIFKDCAVRFWQDMVNQDSEYEAIKNKVTQLCASDSHFQTLLHNDAEKVYTPFRALEYTDKDAFIAATISDLVEHITIYLIATKNGFKFIFYPGKNYNCVAYVLDNFLSSKCQIKWINVFIYLKNCT